MIAITGANGLLGSFIVRKLIEQNESFVALKRKGSDISLLSDVQDKIKWRDGDVTDAVALSEALVDVTHVIHTAAIVSFNPARADEVMDINVQGTRNLVNICLAHNIKRLVHVSSVAALGRQKGQTSVDENNKWVDSPMATAYATSKYFAELEIFRGEEEGLSTVIINPSLILAGANWNQSSAQLFKYVWSQRRFYIDGVLNYVDVNDLTELIYKLLHSDIKGERFIVSAGKISYKDFFEKIARLFNRRPPSIKIGRNFLKVGAVVERIRTWFVGGEPAITRETARLAGSDFLFENKKVRNRLNFEFQPIDRTLQRCCEYYLAKNSLKK